MKKKGYTKQEILDMLLIAYKKSKSEYKQNDYSAYYVYLAGSVELILEKEGLIDEEK